MIDRAEHPEFDHVREDFVVFDDNALMYYRYTDDERNSTKSLTLDEVSERDAALACQWVVTGDGEYQRLAAEGYAP